MAHVCDPDVEAAEAKVGILHLTKQVYREGEEERLMTAIIDAATASETEGWLTRSALRQSRCAPKQEFPARTSASCYRIEAGEQRAYGIMAEQLGEPPEILVLALPPSVDDVRAVRRPNSEQASAVRPPRSEAIGHAREFNPSTLPLVERVRYATGGSPDKALKRRRGASHDRLSEAEPSDNPPLLIQPQDPQELSIDEARFESGERAAVNLPKQLSGTKAGSGGNPFSGRRPDASWRRASTWGTTMRPPRPRTSSASRRSRGLRAAHDGAKGNTSPAPRKREA